MDISIKLTYKSCPNSFMYVINFKWTPTADTCKEEKKSQIKYLKNFIAYNYSTTFIFHVKIFFRMTYKDNILKQECALIIDFCEKIWYFYKKILAHFHFCNAFNFLEGNCSSLYRMYWYHISPWTHK
jgi:hypothetical protein